jgi:hypothetical protein
MFLSAGARATYLSALVLMLFGCGGSGETTQDPPSGGEFLFTQTAEGGIFEVVDRSEGRYRITLTNVYPGTVFFSDRPQRIAGSAPMSDFLKGMSFSDNNPPNAAIVVPNGEGEADDEIIVAELTNPQWDGVARTLQYDVKILRDATGQLAIYNARKKDFLPESFGTTTVLIDDCPPYETQVHVNFRESNGDSTVLLCPNAEQSWFRLSAEWSWKTWYCMPKTYKDAPDGLTAWDRVYGDVIDEWTRKYPSCCSIPNGNGCDVDFYFE